MARQQQQDDEQVDGGGLPQSSVADYSAKKQQLMDR